MKITREDELKQFRAQQLTRRALLGKATQGLGALAFASLEAKASPLTPARRGESKESPSYLSPR